MKKIFTTLSLALLAILISQTGFSLSPYSHDCTVKTHLKAKYLCHRFILLSKGGADGYYQIDLEQVQTIGWGQVSGANTIKFKNGDVMTFPNYDAYEGFQKYLIFLEGHPEFIK